MTISVYKESLVYGLTQVTNYRSEVWLTILNKFVYLASIIFLWSIIGKTVNGISGVTSLTSYFLIANGVQGLVDAESLRYSKVINKEVKLGGLSAHLLRPINPVLFLYFSFLGTRGVTLLMTIILMTVGFVFLPSITVFQIILFLISLLMAFVVGFVFNLFVGSLSFWTPEANHLQNVFSHIIRVFSGVLIPISFFSGTTKTLLLLSPFPALAYLLSIIMQTKIMNTEMWMIFGASIFWSGLLLPMSFWFWKKGIRRYEAIGI
ncbi:MAG: hypothetical protein UW41_C0027G0002 [Candidatus Collierbacteria bacterium GW2011_GWC2_44_18]|uniref:ABC-2 type transporter n=1 Tax=Candidatus Collierbacteria bacterium GW2011_GWC2_44_18 TaxID=1618392 RepID=A0A0G1KKM2_9BACT|nr:MAG: hypothetical protein UW16_C0025G0009 [Microgenomates group bacterium GW2011_GWC1_44_10]KKT48489.1 MAG: hypothetical protein UW41_C0027G0002 [Candidatus Collierbacteria bacterium GW2011_GWC2_44_18]